MVKDKLTAGLFFTGVALIALSCVLAAPYLMIVGVLFLIAAAVADNWGIEQKQSDTLEDIRNINDFYTIDCANLLRHND